jgi:uncharacterized protein DUF2188
MHNARYIVLYQEGKWKIVRAGRRYSGTYPTKTQAMCAAIEYAEKDGGAGHEAEVLVRHEDGRFMIEWMFGHDLQPDPVARPMPNRSR